jgi:pimeloyl-ACP methyl ester carboxylesterase
LALSQPTLLGLTQQQAKELQPLVAHRYALLEQSALYSNVKSALPYCFSAQRPTNGLASAYVPTGATSNTPTILFIHGYGGSFLWYQHYLSENFPGHIIISPAYGISGATIPQAYVAESVDAVSKRLGFKLSNSNLIGLSAGGFGACRLYTLEPRFYRQMICLAAYPPDDTLSQFRRNSRPRFLVGAMEPYVATGEFNRRIDRVRRVCSTVEAETIPKSDHFFLLTEQAVTVDSLRKWLTSDPAENRAP